MRFKLLLASFLILFIFASAEAEEEGHGLGLAAGPGIAQKLALSDKQQEQLRNCSTPGEGRKLMMRWVKEREVLNQMVRQKEESEEVVFKQFEVVINAYRAFNLFRLEKMLKAREVLTEEQLETLNEIRASRPRRGPAFDNEAGHHFHGGNGLGHRARTD